MSNTAAEKVFLAGAMQHPDKFLDFVEYLADDDFTHSATKMTFAAIQSLVVDKEAMQITKAKLVAEAKAMGHHNYLSVTKNGQWLDELEDEPVGEHELRAHFIEVKRQALIRAYTASFDTMRDYLTTTDDPLSSMIANVENSVVNNVTLLDRGEHEMVDLAKGMEAFVNDLADDPGHLGLDLGYPVWQDRIGQLRNGSVTFVVATAKAGKSQFALKAALNAAWRQKVPVLLLDSELNERDQRIRLAGMMTKVPYQVIENGYWKMTAAQLRSNDVPADKIPDIMGYGRRLRDLEVWKRMDELPISYQSISGMDVKDAIPLIRRWLLTRVKPPRDSSVPQCLVVYDYIKLASLDDVRRGVAEWQQHGVNVAMLHDMMKKYNIPCLAFGQTNNEITDGFKCVAGGKRISENVTSITHFKKKTEEERGIDGTGTHMVQVFGTRYGSGTEGGHINVDSDLSIGEFTELGMSGVNINAERQRRLQEFRDRQRRERDDND